MRTTCYESSPRSASSNEGARTSGNCIAFFPRRAVVAALTVVILAAPAAATAQFGGVRIDGIRLVLEGTPPDRVRLNQGPVSVTKSSTNPSPSTTVSNRTLFNDPAMLTSRRLCAALNQPQTRSAVNAGLYEIIASQTRSKLPRGFGLHSESNHQIGNACEARAEIVGNRVTVFASIPRNRFFARITTPDGVPGELDPNFHVFYDLDVRATFLLPETTSGRLVQESISGTATNITRPATRSLTGKAALAANDLVDFLGGPDFVARVRGNQRFAVGSLVSVDLGEFNRQLAGAAKNLRLEKSYRNNVLVLTATSRPAPPPPIVR